MASGSASPARTRVGAEMELERDLASEHGGSLGGEGLAVAAQSVGEHAEARRPRLGDGRGVLGLERGDDRLVGDRAPVDAPALDDSRADAAYDQPPDAITLAGEEQRDDRAHRIADQVDPRCADQLEEDGEVAGHALLPVAGGVVRLLGVPVAPGVGGDDPAPRGEQRIDDAGGHPVSVGVGDEAVVQHDGRRRRLLAPFLVGDLDPIPGLVGLDGGCPLGFD